MAEAIQRNQERGELGGGDDHPEHVGIQLKNNKALKRKA
jgi:hypothetical protein